MTALVLYSFTAGRFQEPASFFSFDSMQVENTLTLPATKKTVTLLIFNWMNNIFLRIITSVIFVSSVGLTEPVSAQDQPGLMMRTARDYSSQITLNYQDTLLLNVNQEFDLPVIIKKQSKISAISLGFFYDPVYLEIDSMILAKGTSGFFFSVNDSAFQMAWSSIQPLELEDGDTLLMLNMKALDISDLTNTLRLRLNEISELADTAANPIEDVVLEIPEIGYLIPDHHDSIGESTICIYPNPFRDHATVFFTLKVGSEVKITVNNSSGIEIFTLTDRPYEPGNHEIRLDKLRMPRGIYLLKFEIRNSDNSGQKVFKIISAF